MWVRRGENLKQKTIFNDGIAQIKVDVDSFAVIKEGYSFDYETHDDGEAILLHTIPFREKNNKQKF